MLQALIMAAGKGSRLGALTSDQPKCFMEINGKKIIDHHLSLFKEAGIKDIVVVGGYQFGKLENHLADKDVQLIYNPLYAHCNVLGSFWTAQHTLKEDFIFLHGDTLFEKSILSDLISAHGDINLVVDNKPCGEEEMKYLMDSDQHVVRIDKQISSKEAHGEFIGLAKFSARSKTRITHHAKQLLMEGKVNEYFEAALQRVIDEKSFQAQTVPVNGRIWNEIDFEADLELLRKKMA